MTNQEMIQRYLYAATKDLPANMREDVARELESLVDDMLAERGTSVDSATMEELKAMLAEIGTPEEIYGRYSPDGAQALIGPPYYAKYKFVLKIALYCVGLTLFGLGLFTVILNWANPWEAVSAWVSNVISGLAFGFAAVTIVFAVLQRKNVPLDSNTFDFDSLLPVPQKGQVISKGDSIAGIVLSIAFTVLFIFCPQIFSFYRDGVGGPIFNNELLQSRWLLLVIGCAFSLAASCFGMFEGRYTMRFAFVQLACNIGDFIATVLFLSGASIMNPEFLSIIGEVVDSETGLRFLGSLNLVIIAIVALSLVLETGTAFGKAMKAKYL